jgi:hypothetical protein
MDKIVRKIIEKCEQLSIPSSQVSVFVSIADQKLWTYRGETRLREYTVSTSAKPPSCVENSGGTPTGLHRVEQKIGEEEKVGTVFFSRVSTGQSFWEFDDEIQTRNLITTRILWLKGLELGHNSGEGIDSFRRYIYIHGTNHEERLGKPASGGCIVLSNTDIIHLYDQVPAGSLVFIEDTV